MKQIGHIVIEGPIGVGKTTLAKRLSASFDIDLILELPEENPFLSKFYTDKRAAALPTQLYFLCQRERQLKAVRQKDLFRSAYVVDFLIQKDRLFAELNLDDDEFSLYMQIYDHLAMEITQPDLVIYLQAPVDILYHRVKKRGCDYERKIEENYLKEVVEAYVNFFYQYTDTPLLIVNTAEVDLATDEHHYQLLLSYIRKLPVGRHYFNPKELARYG